MRLTSAIVTDKGGVTCHAAIVSRELGVTCVVGTENATQVMETGKEYTVDARSDVVYEGLVKELVHPTPPTPTAKEVGLTPKMLTIAQPTPVTSTKIFRDVARAVDSRQEVANFWFGTQTSTLH